MKTKLIILVAVLMTSLACHAENKAMAHVESSGNANVKDGDGGKAIGKYQFHKAAWVDTTEWRKKKGLATHDYSQARNEKIADQYVVSRLEQLKELFKKETGRQPSFEELYATWNLGLTGFKKRNFDLKKCPAITQRAAKVFAQKSRSTK